MSDFQAIADRVEIEALRGEFTDAAMMRDYGPRRVAVHPGRRAADAEHPRELARPGADPRGGERVPAAVGLSWCRTTHPGTIRLDGDTATGRAYLQELGRGRGGAQGLNYAIYHDRYQRTGEGWKFTERVYEVRYRDTTALAGSAPRTASAPASPQDGSTSAAEGARADTRTSVTAPRTGNADPRRLLATTSHPNDQTRRHHDYVDCGSIDRRGTDLLLREAIGF